MMMERVRWLVAVLVAFVAGWVGHAVYGDWPRHPLPPVSAVAAAPAPSATEAAPDASAPASPPAPEPATSPDGGEPSPPSGPGQVMRTPAAADVVMREMERANAKWFEDFRAEPLDAAWAAATEASIRQDLLTHRPWGSADLESLECRSRNCYMVLIVRAPAAGEPAPTRRPDDAFPGLSTFVAVPTPVEGDPRALRMEVFITRPAVTPGG
jgi:hypothetical protein